MYKKIYLEITNNCNLNCNFCAKNKRTKAFLDEEKFHIILDKIKPHTKYLYFHLMGEPLLHPKINEYIDYASKDFFINITTNGYLINKIKNNKNIRQLNISLHSFNEFNITLEKYMNSIFESIDILSKQTYISLRLWVKNKDTINILNLINKKYNLSITLEDLENKKFIKIKDNVFINNFHEFIWPNLNNKKIYQKGTCYALIDHIGILVDGTIVPCCLDSEGTINLGNIFSSDINDIKNNKRYINMLEGFKNHKKCELLCKTCNFLDR